MWARRPFGLVSPAVKPASRSHASASLIVRVLNINQSRALSWHMMFHSQCGLWNERYPVDGSTSVPSSCNARSSHVRNLCSIHWIREKPRALQRTDQRKANRWCNPRPAPTVAVENIFFQFTPIRRSATFLQSMEEENLDDIAPLRHLFSSDDSDDLLLPAPPPPRTDDQIVQINFLAPLNHQPEESYRTITLSLSVDPSPGCGGIAWPAGEVGSAFLTVVIYRHRYLLSCSLFIVIMARHCPTCVICRS
jgi:hypothetical protein